MKKLEAAGTGSGKLSEPLKIEKSSIKEEDK